MIGDPAYEQVMLSLTDLHAANPYKSSVPAVLHVCIMVCCSRQPFSPGNMTQSALHHALFC